MCSDHPQPAATPPPVSGPAVEESNAAPLLKTGVRTMTSPTERISETESNGAPLSKIEARVSPKLTFTLPRRREYPTSSLLRLLGRMSCGKCGVLHVVVGIIEDRRPSPTTGESSALPSTSRVRAKMELPDDVHTAAPGGHICTSTICGSCEATILRAVRREALAGTIASCPSKRTPKLPPVAVQLSVWTVPIESVSVDRAKRRR